MCDQINILSLLIVLSGRVNSQSYRADLELQGKIAVDRCCWEMKSNEPVLKLVKQQQGHWEKLLGNKVLELHLFGPPQKYTAGIEKSGKHQSTDSNAIYYYTLPYCTLQAVLFRDVTPRKCDSHIHYLVLQYQKTKQATYTTPA